MNIIVNGDPRDVPDTMPMADLVEALGLTGQRIAVEVNEQLVPRSTFDSHRLAPGDRIEIIQAVGGG
jgi:sulfur carrier protein